MKFQLITSCIEVPPEQVDDVHAMIASARDIEFSTFARRCDWAQWARDLGYVKGFHIKDDWHVRYRKSRWLGKPCYFAVWSAIEFIFVEKT